MTTTQQSLLGGPLTPLVAVLSRGLRYLLSLLVLCSPPAPISTPTDHANPCSKDVSWRKGDYRSFPRHLLFAPRISPGLLLTLLSLLLMIDCSFF